MLVVEVDLQLLHAWLQEVEVPAFGVRTSGADELQRGVLGAKGIRELLQTLGEDGTEAAVLLVVVPLFVAHAEELQVEGLGMAHVGTHLAPFCRDVAIGKLHEVEGILYIVIQLVDRHVNARLRGVRVLELATQTTGNDGQRLTAEVLAELEELEEA